MRCRDTPGQANALQLGMTSELVADSFLKTLFTRFYQTLQLHSPISHKGLQARLPGRKAKETSGSMIGFQCD